MVHDDDVESDIARLRKLGALGAAFTLQRVLAENAELRRRVAELELGLEQCDLRPLIAAVDATVVALEATVGARRYLRAVR